MSSPSPYRIFRSLSPEESGTDASVASEYVTSESPMRIFRSPTTDSTGRSYSLSPSVLRNLLGITSSSRSSSGIPSQYFPIDGSSFESVAGDAGAATGLTGGQLGKGAAAAAVTAAALYGLTQLLKKRGSDKKSARKNGDKRAPIVSRKPISKFGGKRGFKKGGVIKKKVVKKVAHKKAGKH